MEKNNMVIVTDEFILRPWKDEDAERLATIANNKKIADYLRDGFPHPYSIGDAKEFIFLARQIEDDFRTLAIEINGVLAGSIGVYIKKDVHRRNMEIGYFLGEEYWGKGIMTNVLGCMAQYVFENFDVVRIYAEPFASNKASRRVLEKAGFRLEATLRKSIVKNGVVQDSCIYAILKEEFDAKCNGENHTAVADHP